MSRGTVDAMTLPPMSAVPYRLDEVASHATEGAPLGGFTLTFSISESLWQSLPPQHRAAMRTAGAETVQHLCAAMTEETEEARAELEAGGMTFTSLTPEQQARWQEEVATVRADWVAAMQARDRPGRAALTAMEQAMERARATSTEASR